ncbi:MAG: glycosyltransferase family 2 protein, partial [Paludibacteraceae bacterium]|nr:glycosyltransferase family 2 protein [Paludibacteraceae bacterium]
MKKTAVVILNYNGEKMLQQFLPSVVKYTPEDLADVIVADNASTDKSLEILSSQFPGVKTVVFDKNYGFAGGYNLAISKIDYEYILLLNSDVEATEGYLEPLVEALDKDPDVVSVQPKLLAQKEKDKFEYAGAAGGFLDKYGYPFCRGRIFENIETDNHQYDNESDVLWTTGAAMLVRRKEYLDNGGLDDRFFAHQEEIDLCWRLASRGYRLRCIPTSTLYHVGGGTLDASNPRKTFLNFRNNLLMLENNLAKTYALQLYKKGYTAERAARKGLRRANMRIFLRRDLDGAACVGYMIQGKWKLAESVEQANAEYLKLRQPVKSADIVVYLENFGRKATVRGLYGRSIVIRSLIKRKNIFSSIK